MKTKTYCYLVVLALLGWFAPALLAQDAAPSVIVSPGLPADASNIVLELLFKLAAAHPWIATVITVVGSMRVWAKPLFAALHALVEVTPSKYDDGLWAMAYRFFTENPVGKSIAWLLDYLASVKIPAPAKPAPDNQG